MRGAARLALAGAVGWSWAASAQDAAAAAATGQASAASDEPRSPADEEDALLRPGWRGARAGAASDELPSPDAEEEREVLADDLAEAEAEDREALAEDLAEAEAEAEVDVRAEDLPRGRDLRPVDQWGELQPVDGDPVPTSDPGHLPPHVRRDALLRSLLAGLSTALGAAVVLLLRGTPSPGQMAFALALAGGVMLTVSVMEMFLPQLRRPERWLEGALAAGAGAGAFAALRKFLPEPEYAKLKDDEDDLEMVHSASAADPGSGVKRRQNIERVSLASLEAGDAFSAAGAAADDVDKKHAKRWRLAVLLTVSLTAHNFPEGLAVAVSSLSSDHLGFVVMAAIAMHNIPEGIAIAMPVLEATGSRWRAMQMAVLSGLAEPLGALVAVTVLPADAVEGRGMDALLCGVGGVMTSVAFTELLPEALAERQPAYVAAGVLAGFVVMMLTHELA